MKKKELKKQLEQQIKINNIAVGENYSLNQEVERLRAENYALDAEVNRTETHMRLCEKANERYKTIISYLEQKLIERISDDI